MEMFDEPKISEEVVLIYRMSRRRRITVREMFDLNCSQPITKLFPDVYMYLEAPYIIPDMTSLCTPGDQQFAIL